MGSQVPVLRCMGCPLGTAGGICLLSETFVETRKCIQQPKAGGWFPLHELPHYAQAWQEPQPTVPQFVQIPPASISTTFLGWFWASTIGRDIIWYIFYHILKHSLGSSGNKRGNDSEGTISHSTSKGFFSLTVTDAPTLSARKDGEPRKFLGFLQLFWRAFVAGMQQAAEQGSFYC